MSGYAGRDYAITGSSSLAASATLPLVTIMGTAAVRTCVYDYMFGSSGTPADAASSMLIQRCSTAGTPGSSPTPAPLDTGDPASVTTSGLATFTVGPTLGTTLGRFGFNQRATYRWIAAPGGELRIPATAANGLAFVPVAVSTAFTTEFTIYFAE